MDLNLAPFHRAWSTVSEVVGAPLCRGDGDSWKSSDSDTESDEPEVRSSSLIVLVGCGKLLSVQHPHLQVRA